MRIVRFIDKDLVVELQYRFDSLCRQEGHLANKKRLTLHWKLMCSRFKPPISGGAPSNVGPKTIDRLEIDMEFLLSSFWILGGLACQRDIEPTGISTHLSRCPMKYFKVA